VHLHLSVCLCLSPILQSQRSLNELLSQRSLKVMEYSKARTQSLIAAYLGVATIIFGMFGISAIILFTLGFQYA